MGKDKSASLGRSLIKDRFGNKLKTNHGDSFLHTAELNDGYDWNRLNLQSVTEENSLNEFLSTAELAGTEFAAEKLNVTFVNPRKGLGLLSHSEKQEIDKAQKEYEKVLKIPRRPKWNTHMSTEELKLKEKEEFLLWRKNLALFQENSGLIMTPYEKNLDFWRQLWRVVERSDILVQIVDARNPLLFRSADLERYVEEVDKKKLNLILCNKADFLTFKQRQMWAKYFDSIEVVVVFFSALKSIENCDKEISIDENNDKEEISRLEEKEDRNTRLASSDSETNEVIGSECDCKIVHQRRINSCELMTREALINFFRTYYRMHREAVDNNVITIGLVGYPNVGKSSTINALLTDKKVPVSATPGKTKHFQTIFLAKDLMLCDCPGLVMPSFALTKADMIINGILPIDQMRDHIPPVNLICSLIPRNVFEVQYNIMIPKPEEGEDPSRPPFSEELLNAYAYNRGFMTANGEPDNSRAARYVLKDFVNGKLLYCHAPPNVSQEEFHVFEEREERSETSIPPQALRKIKPFKVVSRDLEYSLFQEQSTSNAYVKGIRKLDSNDILRLQIKDDKPAVSNKSWKNHKEKRNKHVKLRVKYKCLDD